MATKPLYLILGIIHSRLAKHVGPRVLDERLSTSIKPALQRIGEGIRELKMKDLKLSQDQLQSLLVRLENKFSGESLRNGQ